MTLGKYFDKTKGTGVLSTAGSAGEVDAAIYARPHVIDEQTVSFIMADRLTHANLQANPHATYLFVEDGGSYQGRRLYLTKVAEETDPGKIALTRRWNLPAQCCPDGDRRYLVSFRIEKVRPLTGE